MAKKNNKLAPWINSKYLNWYYMRRARVEWYGINHLNGFRIWHPFESENCLKYENTQM